MTTWMKFECGKGSRWTAVSPQENDHGKTCNFSGCNCNTKVVLIGTTDNRNEAAQWFRLPK